MPHVSAPVTGALALRAVIVHSHKALEQSLAGELLVALAAVQVDAENCFGLLEWGVIRKVVQEENPALAPIVAWKHTAPSYIEHEGVQPQAKRPRSRAR